MTRAALALVVLACGCSHEQTAPAPGAPHHGVRITVTDEPVSTVESAQRAPGSVPTPPPDSDVQKAFREVDQRPQPGEQPYSPK